MTHDERFYSALHKAGGNGGTLGLAGVARLACLPYKAAKAAALRLASQGRCTVFQHRSAIMVCIGPHRDCYLCHRQP